MEFLIKITCLTSVALIVLFIHQGEAIKCWECRSDADPKCADPFDNATFAITDCKHSHLDWLPDVKATMCRKIRQKFHGVWKYIRGCAFLGEPGIEGDERFCLMRTGTYNIFMEYCTCNTKDGCNQATKITKISTILLIMTLILPLVLTTIR